MSRLQIKLSSRRSCVAWCNLARNNRFHARGISRNLFASAAAERSSHAARCAAARAWRCSDMRRAADSTTARSAISALSRATGAPHMRSDSVARCRSVRSVTRIQFMPRHATGEVTSRSCQWREHRDQFSGRAHLIATCSGGAPWRAVCPTVWPRRTTTDRGRAEWPDAAAGTFRRGG